MCKLTDTFVLISLLLILRFYNSYRRRYVTDNVVSNDITITSVLRSDTYVIIFGINLIF